MTESEEKILNLVECGILSIDSEGKLWRHFIKTGNLYGTQWKPIDPPRQAEHHSRYLDFAFQEGEKTYRASIHRLVWIYFYGDIPAGLELNHKDGNKHNNHPNNLEVVTRSQNRLHAYATGLEVHKRGEDWWNSKLTDKQVREIRRLYATGQYSQEQLGKQFGVSQTQIGQIVLRKQWTHIGD